MRSRRGLLLSLGAGLALVACRKTPDPPGQCPLVLDLPDIGLRGRNLPRLTLRQDLDALREQIVAGRDERRDHLVQEYLLAANQLPEDKRAAALASIRDALASRRTSR